MNIFPAWLSAEVQARIEPPPILLINKDPPEANEYEILKINMRQNSSDAALETYKLNIFTFDVFLSLPTQPKVTLINQ